MIEVVDGLFRNALMEDGCGDREEGDTNGMRRAILWFQAAGTINRLGDKGDRGQCHSGGCHTL